MAFATIELLSSCNSELSTAEIELYPDKTYYIAEGETKRIKTRVDIVKIDPVLNH